MATLKEVLKKLDKGNALLIETIIKNEYPWHNEVFAGRALFIPSDLCSIGDSALIWLENLGYDTFIELDGGFWSIDNCSHEYKNKLIQFMGKNGIKLSDLLSEEL